MDNYYFFQRILGGKKPKLKLNYSVSPGLSQSYKAVTHSQGMTGDVRCSNLDWDGFSVSDHSAQLNHRLQTRNGTFNFSVDEILPRLERKDYNCFIFITSLWADWKHFTPFLDISCNRLNYALVGAIWKMNKQASPLSLWRRWGGNNMLKTNSRAIFISFVSTSHKVQDWVIQSILVIANKKYNLH